MALPFETMPLEAHRGERQCRLVQFILFFPLGYFPLTVFFSVFYFYNTHFFYWYMTLFSRADSSPGL